MKNSVFKIKSTNGTGTGFIVDGFDYVITSFQIIQGHKKVTVENYDKEKQIGKVIYINETLDIALLEIPSPSSHSAISLDSFHNAMSNDELVILGYPFGMNFTMTKGIISNPRQKIGNQIYLQTDAALNQGIIGGPMVSAEGKLLALATNKASDADNIAFGIPFSEILEVVKSFDPQKGKFQVQCHSCKNITPQKEAFCPTCGSQFNPILFEDATMNHLGLFVENAIQSLGMDPILARSGKNLWEFHQGSALIKLFVYKNDYLIASSKLNKLPKDNLESLFVYLLEDHHFPYTLGIVDNHIHISYRVHLSDVYSSKVADIKKNVANLALKADDLDNYFQEKYGCEFAIEAKI